MMRDKVVPTLAIVFSALALGLSIYHAGKAEGRWQCLETIR